MAIMESLRRLDERVLPSPEKERSRLVRGLPWLAGGALVFHGFDVFFMGQPEFVEGIVLVYLAGTFTGTLQMSRWLRKS